MMNACNFNYDSFSHGQIKSKLWLCEKLEQHLPTNSNIAILGAWYNVLAFMLLTRNTKNYTSITGIDNSEDAISIANRICDYWIIENNKVKNWSLDANTVVFNFCNVVINCSSEHMENTYWFANIPAGTLVCIQSSNVTDTKEPWYIKNPSHSIIDFANKYPVSSTLFLDALPIRYQGWGYDRYMLIGIK
jgi:trans-aconitate methyltransferase